MENRKLIKFLIPILLLGFFVVYNPVFAYSIETHASLTNEIVKFYNQNFPGNKIPDELKNYLIDGSRREDDIPRWMNHFYDPVYNRGLTDSVLGTWQKSKDWAQDSNNQNSLTYKVPATIASVLTAVQQQKISAISAETDFTWQKAIKFYVQGEKEKAMFILGHILHLIEDKSVPDHTRNDPHPGDSPYENWTERFTLNNPDKELSQRLNNDKPLVFTDLNSYFNELAKYSNNNFYSKDRIGIQTGYELPEPDYFKKDGIYFYGFKTDKGNSDYHLLAYKKPPSKYLWAFNEEITLKDEGQDFIVFDYWSRLSAKSVQYGAGVINLFLQEVEKAKNDPNFAKTEEKSIFAKALETAKNLLAQVGDFFSGSSDGFQPAGEISLNQSQDSSISGDQTSNIASQNIKQCSFNVSQSPSRQKVVINEIAWMGGVNSADDEWIELKNISNAAINLSGYQLIDQAEQIKIIFGENDKISANSFYLLEKTDDNTVPNIKADKIYTGRLSNTNEGLRLFDSNCNLIDEVLANPNWPAGDNSAKKTMERNGTNFSWYTSSVIGGTPKKENSQPVLVKKQELSINLLEETEEDDEEIAPQQEQTQQATSSPQQTQQTATFKQCAFQTNQSSSRQKVIINEIAWMGMPPKAGETNTQASNNEWIELKNISGSKVDLTGWQLLDADENIKVVFGEQDKRKIINKTIPANGFYLLERTDDDSVPGITADFVYSGALSNDGKSKPEGLRLFDKQCNLIDEVLANSSSDGKQWPAGDNSTKKTMERDANGFGWHTSSIVGGTPKKENSIPSIATTSGSSGGGGGTPTNTQQQTATETKITEIMYNPEGNDTGREWIEIFNAGALVVNLEGWKFYEGGTNHNLSVFRGSATISPGGYVIIADDPEKFLNDWPNYSGTIFDSSFSLNNTGETIAIKNGDLIIDQVNYQSSWGANDNGKSLQLINNEWKEAQPTPGQPNQISSNNQSPSAFFVYTPQSPQTNDLITFNAASSTDSDGQIISYQWNFGDNTTSSVATATTTHSYSQAGNYLVSLIVFDNQNASSTLTSTTISVSSSGANHIVISEILFNPQGSDEGKEFIELYNPTNNDPTNNDIDIKNWSLRILKDGATSTDLLAKFGFKAEDITLIKSKDFLLAGFNNYTSTNTPADIIRSATLPNSTSTIYLIDNNGAEVDRLSYSDSSISTEGQSLERKAWQNNSCVSAQGDGEFLGNGCDTNNADDFEIRDTPNPQNSQSLPEPRNPPTTPQDFTLKYSSSTMELIFDWQASQDYSGTASTLTYKITDISNTSSTLPTIETASTTAKTSINEVGSDYQFSIQAFDKEGLGSATSTASSTVPSFIKSALFFQDPRTTSSSPVYLIDLYYDNYPFIPRKYNSNISGLIFYLNQENPPVPQSINLGGLFGCLYGYATMPEAMKIYYPNYSFYSYSSGNVVVLPNTLGPPDLYNQLYGGLPGGVYQYIINRDQLEDNHLRIEVRENFEKPPSQQDYFKVAFYSYTIDRRSCEQILVGFDQTKYYFQENLPLNSSFLSPPTTPTNFQVNFQTESDNPYFLASWATSTDPDSLNQEINYHLDYWPENNPADKNQWLGKQNSIQIYPSSSGNYIFELKAFDEFNLYSGSIFASSTAYVSIVLAEQINSDFLGYNAISFGGRNSLGSNSIQKIAQSFEIENRAKISSFSIRLSNCSDCENFSGAKISLRKSENNSPSEEIIYAVSLRPDEIPKYGGMKNFSFFISPLIELEAGIYFLVIEPENSPPDWPWNLVSLYPGRDYYQKGSLYAYYVSEQQISRWANYGSDTYFRVKGFFVE